MEILLICCCIGFTVAMLTIVMDDIKFKKSQNNVHFYLQKDETGYYSLSLGKPLEIVNWDCG